MNKLIFSLAALTLLLAASCEKQAPLQPCNTPGVTHTPGNDGIEEEWGLNWWWKESHLHCIPYALDCFDEVDVNPALGEIVDEFEHAIANGSTGVASFFNGSNWDDLFPGLTGDTFGAQLSALQSGDYYIDTSIEESIYHYLVKENGTGNLEFVLRLDKSLL